MITVVLVSGGIDSTVAADEADPKAILLSVDYGQPERAHEKTALDRLFGTRVRHVTSHALAKCGDVYYPARNLLLATLAAQQPEAATRHGVRVIMAGLADDHCADKNPQAFAAMSQILTAQCGYPVSVESPYWELTKVELVECHLARPGHRRGNRLLDTFSCYRPRATRPCRSCPACFRWSVALLANGVNVPPPKDGITREYLGKLHTYKPSRIWSVLQALKVHRPVLVVDIDGVLTCETEGHDYVNRTPKPGAPEALLDLCKSLWVVLHSSRRESDRVVTIDWLGEHGFVYDALLLEKPPATQRVDDLTVQAIHEVTAPA